MCSWWKTLKLARIIIILSLQQRRRRGNDTPVFGFVRLFLFRGYDTVSLAVLEGRGPIPVEIPRRRGNVL
jgi:hypothetical protein